MFAAGVAVIIVVKTKANIIAKKPPIPIESIAYHHGYGALFTASELVDVHWQESVVSYCDSQKRIVHKAVGQKSLRC